MIRTVASFGGGVNSTAMLIGWQERGLTVDAVLFADTGGEKPKTYAHRDEFSAWLVAHGFPPIITVREERWTLEQQCLDNHTLPSIVVGYRSCSDHFKIRPQNRWVGANFPAGSIVKYVGFDAGEPWRAKDFDKGRVSVRYPLVEWGWDRDACVAAIERTGLAVPPKSSCFFCPEMREEEILDLRDENPELFERALAMERNNTQLVTIKGLGRTISWQQIADYDRDQIKLLPVRPDRLPCVCMDGE